MHKYYFALAILYIVLFLAATNKIENYYWIYLALGTTYGLAAWHEMAQKDKQRY